MAQYRHYSNGTSDHVSIGIRASSSSSHQQKSGRVRRLGYRSDKSSRGGCSLIGAVIVFLCLVLVVTVLAYYFLSTEITINGKDVNVNHVEDDLMKNDDFLTNVTRTDTIKVLGFGQGSVGHGRDSRYWDRDDRRRDEDYNEDDVEHDSKVLRDGESSEKGNNLVRVKNYKEKVKAKRVEDRKGVGLYNEDGRKELKMYEKEYEASLKSTGKLGNKSDINFLLLDDEDTGEQNGAVDSENDYNDGIDFHDPRMEEYGADSEHDKEENSSETTVHVKDNSESSNFLDAKTKDENIAKENQEDSMSLSEKGSLNSQNSGDGNTDSRHANNIGGHSTSKSRPDSKKKSKRHKSGCGMKFLNSTTRLVEPFESRKFARFSLQYTEIEEKPEGQEQWKPRFAGHQSLHEREDSFLAQDQKIKCGFVKGPEGSSSTGFDLAEDDESYISRCHIAVISCIFGNSDRLRSPVNKMVTRLSRKNVCFVMFVDEVTLQTLSSEGHIPDTSGFIGLWKIVVVKNLPYDDMRRVGKVPKLLPHRLFPSARYSIWLDSKLRLQVDPLLVLEYFLWRKGFEFAISKHYDRHCVWEEVDQNKRLNKYNHTVIDQQFASYKSDGLKRFNVSDPNKLLPSNVPEGSFIVRAHTPMSNLFSCLWFNEVDRFTPRDQLSFAFTYQKLRRMNPDKPFYLHMFKDCERRAIAKLFRHKSEDKRTTPRQEATE
uniref:TOD1/MUCI70 glycosyltransferase-like domain-containing protein n=1 Tax=Salix viminalis TaxID=40686 RepID=A0A6N2LSZ4_SALVM